MRAFIVSLLAAAVLAVCSVVVLNLVQESAATAYSTSGVHLTPSAIGNNLTM